MPYYRLDSIEILRVKIQHLSFLRNKRKISVKITISREYSQSMNQNLVVD